MTTTIKPITTVATNTPAAAATDTASAVAASAGAEADKRLAPVRIRHYQAQDLRPLTDLFYASVHQLACTAYDGAQLHAWAPLPADYPGWQARFEVCAPLVAEVDGRIAGFAALDAEGYIDWLYTHPDFQRRGVASALYQCLETQARERGVKRLMVDASHLARHFFKQRGFLVLNRNEIERQGVTLVNWSMDKLV